MWHLPSLLRIANLVQYQSLLLRKIGQMWYLLHICCNLATLVNPFFRPVIQCCPFTQGHSGVFRFLVVFILRFVKTGTATPLSFPNIRSDPAPYKELNPTVLCSNFLSSNSGILPILPSSESRRLDLSFLKVFNRGSLSQ